MIRVSTIDRSIAVRAVRFETSERQGRAKHGLPRNPAVDYALTVFAGDLEPPQFFL
jgi:hypothetical protein